MSYYLTAEAEGRTTKPIGHFTSMAAATVAVERHEAAGTWPEGFDAVLATEDGAQRWCLVDGWEPC